ncbi:11096_t:CDS:2, partial [Acaulospora colombiana]
TCPISAQTMPTEVSEVNRQNLTLCVPRRSSLEPKASAADNLSRPLVVPSSINELDGSLPPNHVILRVERFGFSANNVTYGLLGEHPHFLYFDFHPAPTTQTTSSKTHGVIPVWGYATVVRSTHSEIQAGERVFGYLGMSRYLVLPVESHVNKFNFYVPRPHLPADRRPYNQMTRCNADPLYDANREDELMIFRPLFWTSFWCEDWLHKTGIINTVQNVIISSASSKTAYCLAFVLDLRRKYQRVAIPKGAKWTKHSGNPDKLRIIGLTSKKNVKFTTRLGLYDEVLSYDDVQRLSQRPGQFAYVDVAGNEELNKKVSKSLEGRVNRCVALGMSHPPGKDEDAKFGNTAQFEQFFMPEWLVKRREELSIQEITGLQYDGWSALMQTCHQWINIERIWWPSAATWMDEVPSVLDVYEEIVGGEVGPERGIIMSMWTEKDTKTDFAMGGKARAFYFALFPNNRQDKMIRKAPPLPAPSSWYPGHMAVFTKNLPQLLQNTHVVLEARDARLPLTSINPNFEKLLKQWRLDKGSGFTGPVERIVVYNKTDLVPNWGVEPFQRALSRYFDHATYFTTAKSGKTLDIAREHQSTLPQLNVLVVGMPNVGKSTLLNHLRGYGLKGVGIKESLFDYEQLADYLLYRLNTIDPMQPPYPSLLSNPTRTRPAFAATESIDDFLIELSERMGYLLSGGVPDKQRTAKWFVEWWRNSAAGEAKLGGTKEWGWGLDCQWEGNTDLPMIIDSEVVTTTEGEKKSDTPSPLLTTYKNSPSPLDLEKRFCQVIERYLAQEPSETETISDTQMKKRSHEKEIQRRQRKRLEASRKRTAAQKWTRRR